MLTSLAGCMPASLFNERVWLIAESGSFFGGGEAMRPQQDVVTWKCKGMGDLPIPNLIPISFVAVHVFCGSKDSDMPAIW